MVKNIQVILESFVSLIDYSGFLIVGGSDGGVAKRVDVYNPHSKKSCRLADLPNYSRFYHQMCGNLLCGGKEGGYNCMLWNEVDKTFSKVSVSAPGVFLLLQITFLRLLSL